MKPHENAVGRRFRVSCYMTMVATGFSFLLALLLLATAVPPAPMTRAQPATDHIALMAFKLQITSDPSNGLVGPRGVATNRSMSANGEA
uniref:Uncharacterized protein n=1 Tax=Oryza meridionalis TaxID=40149 RepID=A0A0E0CHX8_9ORYZ